MNFFGINLKNRHEQSVTLKKVINSLNIRQEEKDLYIISLDILSDTDFTLFFDTLMSQVTKLKNIPKEYSIEPLTSQII